MRHHSGRRGGRYGDRAGAGNGQGRFFRALARARARQYDFCMWQILLLGILLALTACTATQPPSAPLRIDHIAMSAEPVKDGKPLPTFRDHFEKEPKVLYAYVWFENVRSMTGSFPIRAMWFYPSDLRPPVAVSEIRMTPPDSIAQFSFHDAKGIPKGPYQILFSAGPKYTATGSIRFFVGMTEKEAREFMQEDTDARRMMAEAQQKRAEDQPSPDGLRLAREAKKRAESGALVPKERGGAEQMPQGK